MEKENIMHVAVIGAGLMGFGIALEFAIFGHQVRMFNTKEQTSKRAIEQAREALLLMVETKLLTDEAAKTSLERLNPTTDFKYAVEDADYVVESALEILSLKQDIFAKLDELCPPPAILATNTSGFLVTDISAELKHPERVIATHYFQPPHFIPLVEVVLGERTDPMVAQKVARILKNMRKKAIVIDKVLPGFVGNRLQFVLGREIQKLVDKGVCTPEMIDDIISFGFGRRLPYTAHFKRFDLIGLDFLYTSTKEGGRKPWSLIAERVERGELGIKSGKGFYEWPDDSAVRFQRRLNMELIRLLKQDIENGTI